MSLTLPYFQYHHHNEKGLPHLSGLAAAVAEEGGASHTSNGFNSFISPI